MNQLRVKFLGILFLVVLPIFVFGQKLRFYNSEHGLPNSLIHKVSQDDRGYIWIATENGASYFDGMRFTTFRHETNKPGILSSDLVKVIFTDSRGVCWVGTSKGLQIFDRDNNAFCDFSLQYSAFTGTPYVTSIAENKEHNQLLVSVAGFGIMVYHSDSHQIDLETTNKLKELYGTNYLGTLFFDSEGYLWNHSEQGNFFKLNFQAKTLGQLKWSPDLADESRKIVVSAIAEDPVTHNILIGTYNHGILIYDRLLGYIRKPKGESSSKYRIRAILAESKKGNDNELNIWVGSEDSGLKKFDRNLEEIIKPDFQYAPIDLDNCKVHSIIQDEQGNIWAGIFQKGLLIIPKTTNDFEYLKLSASQGSMSVNIACATSITRDDAGDLWVGTDGGGLFRLAENGTKHRYTSENTPLQNNAILTLTTDKLGTMWISTYMGGLTTYNPIKGFQTFSNDIELQKVQCTQYDKENDKLYLGTLGYGVKVLSLSNKKLTAFPKPDFSGWVSSLCLDASGNLWVGHTDGLRCFSTYNGEEVNLELTGKMKGIPINFTFEDMDHSMWFGSPNGLYHIEKETNEFTLYTRDDGLPSNLICAVQQDDNGNLWVSTFNGLSQFDPVKKIFKNYFAYDGLQDNEFRVKTCYKDSDGKMFFGGINGITAFYPNKIYGEEKLLSKINFSQLTVLNHSVNYDKTLGKKNILDRHISQAKKITLKKTQNIFTLEFAVLEYANPQKVVYGYLLKGFDTDWRFTNSNQRLATYTNLPEGAYVFQVKAFLQGNQSEKNVVYNEIDIQILPPWYKSWWAYLIYLAFFMFVVWEFLNYFIRRKLHVQERLELEKKEMKLRMFTDISHEIRTPLSLVISPLKTIQESETDPKRKEIFNLMYRNVLRVIRLLNQLMDVRRIDNHQFKMHFQKTDLFFFIQDIMKSFDQLAILRNIDLRLVSNLESLEVWIDQANFDKVIFNILSNAFKFTPDNGFIMISIDTLRNNNNEVIRSNIDEFVGINIENSGSKIDESEIERIFERFYQSRDNIAGGGSGIGLHLAKMIVSSHHGTIKAQNVENGVAFIINIPLGKLHLSSDEISDAERRMELNKSVQNHMQHPKDSEYVELPQIENATNVSKSHKSKRTLIFIDNDADLVQYIKMEFSEKYHVEVCTDPKEAWKLILTTLPDAVITDLIMPDVDGISLCKRVRQNPETNHLPIVILTSQADEETERMCIENGADHFLTKPINIELLKSNIAQAIQTREMLRNKYQSIAKPDFNDIKMSSPDSRLIAKVIETIRKNIENSGFSVDDLSNEVGLSRVHLNRKLKENINISPSNLIKSIRLKQSAYLLVNNKVNISEVAYKVGFSSHSYFSNNFKEYFGMAPTEFVLKYNESEGKETFNKLFEN